MTDRILDPSYGWELKDRLDVPNPEVMGSTGYIQVLNKYHKQQNGDDEQLVSLS
eukprot:CAMPEP_0118708104 /NCGR_PEP_ID=MMETSP0800-20121206/21662_1 /TAXON_ID=210618 ORGANISM="Striatella unipunctata, Strain CCMP2910" /NCGR_SAMPLE_ID=MMETSP0800 /ASSEMBLY_ACC=CAM_ASM_000638 /LENGTH=53 /DNA_ID=CAMNT_0006611181 /DNA_START=14 /DNA_END=175 /DNA_ORIENTATION=+